MSTKLLLIAALGACSVLAAGCASETGDEEEPIAESEDRLLAGRRLTPAQVAAHIRAAGFPENMVGKMVCTAKYESSFYTQASNRNRNGSTDRGLFQINSIHLGGTSGCPSSAAALWDPTTNARCALAIYRMQGINAWYGYRKHRTECNSYRAPASAAAPSTSNDDNDGNDGNDSTSGTTGGTSTAGGCWSATLQDMVDAGTCVESKYSGGGWFQCKDGEWFRGVSGNQGPFGACTSMHAR